jgi:hypothetical protein
MTALLALVAINTLLFLGLSVAKFVPWPDPVHPRALRERAFESDRSTDAPAAVSIRQHLLLKIAVAMHLVARSNSSHDDSARTRERAGATVS